MKRIPEPELMLDPEQCRIYNEVLSDKDNPSIKSFINVYDLFIDIKKGHIVDLGTGSANFIIKLVKKYPKLKVTCYEGSAAMIDIANKNIKAERLENNITMVHEDMFNAHGEYDAVLANRVLHHVNNTEAFWQLIDRLSNKLLVCDIVRPTLQVFENFLSHEHGYEEDLVNSLRAAYTIDEVLEQTELYDHNVMKEKLDLDIQRLTVYQNK